MPIVTSARSPRRRAHSARPWRSALTTLLAMLLVGCALTPAAPPAQQPGSPPSAAQAATPATTRRAASASPTAAAARLPTPNLPTATVPRAANAVKGHYENAELGVALTYPPEWTPSSSDQETTLTWLASPKRDFAAALFYGPMPSGSTLEQAAQEVRDGTASGMSGFKSLADGAITLADGRPGWHSEFSGNRSDNSPIQVIVTSSARSGRLVTLMLYGAPKDIARARTTLDGIGASLALSVPQLYGIPRDQAIFTLGGESNNPRDYDPATGGGNSLVFSGLVMFNPQLEVVPDLAESWEISADGTVYTFHLRPNARFHDERPVTAEDVIYSWERAADPATDSNSVLTYMGDIVGLREKHAGTADQIAGLKALDAHTLAVTIDGPKPYFLMKLTYDTSAIVDRANIESGPNWYRTPNGTGPYRLIRWEPLKLQLYERFADFYLAPPAVRYLVSQLYAGTGLSLYETGKIDYTGVGAYSLDRLRDPNEPLHRDLREGVSMCTSYMTFDTSQPPFDDLKVRQAFALAVDKQRYIDVGLSGVGIPANGLYPPALPGYRSDLKGLPFDPTLAKQRLAESKYGSADKLPPITFTSGGFGSDVDGDVSALIAMWQQYLGVSIQVENLEPSKSRDEMHAGRHGQIFSGGWCADYPDPENFADALFHSGAEQNLGHYNNPQLDTLLEQARVERDSAKRITMYQQAEQMIVDDAPAIFLNHSLAFMLVKPYVKGYVDTPIAVPIFRYLSLDPTAME